MLLIEIAETEMPKMGKKKITLTQILDDVCISLGFSPVLIKGKCRKKEYVYCRQIYSFIAKLYTSYSFPRIAEEVGYNNHTAILFNVRTVKDYLHTHDERFMEYFDLYKENSKIWPLLN